MTTALVSIISRVITSQQFFLYNSIIFISISIASIPVPATYIPTTNISNNQYMIPAINALGIFVLICATDCPASIVHPIKVCMNDAASWKNGERFKFCVNRKTDIRYVISYRGQNLFFRVLSLFVL